jgi:SAM-dependent methyltransferase
LSRANELAGRNNPGRLLDVGCGEGFVMAVLAEEGWEVAGIDHSRAGVEGMNPHMADLVEQGDLFALLDSRISSGETYDLVWLGNVLEHVLHPVELLRSLKRLVADNGLLVVVVPNDGTPYHEELLAGAAIPERFWIAIPDHISYFTGESLRRTATSTGWVVRDMQGDFPIDFFLSHEGSNYVADRTKGPAAHAARLRLERLIAQAGDEAANRFYSALAGVGLGRNIVAYLAPERGDESV